LKYFSDRNLGITIIRMLTAYEQVHSLIHQDDDGRFTKHSTDVEIITTLGAETPKPVLLTADLYRADPEERKALRVAKLTVVFFKSGFHEVSFHEQAVKCLKIWPELVEVTTRCNEPTVFEIKPTAVKVSRLCKTADLGD
jgi:hypothetical protein